MEDLIKNSSEMDKQYIELCYKFACFSNVLDSTMINVSSFIDLITQNKTNKVSDQILDVVK